MIKRPNFFILGAPKCGTTSLASWLGAHPNIFMSKPKEPRYFNTDYKYPSRPRTLKEYERLFIGATPQHKAIGEASTGYLRSREAIPSILKYCPSPRFIVCLRNPIEMTQSYHSQLVKMGIETEVAFERAWALQEARQKGLRIPITCYDEKVLFYGQNSMLGEQMKRLFQLVSRKQVLVILLEDLKSDPGREYRRVMNFLEVEDDGRKNFPVENVRAIPNFPMLAQVFRLAGLVKIRLGLPTRGFGIHRFASRLNDHKPQSPDLSLEMKSTLKEYFKKDIELLANILDRNLSHWLVVKG